MARAPKSKKRSSPAPQTIHKARGVISPRVQRVGPEHFGIVCVDCAKARSKWMLTDFYGRNLVPPIEVEHTQACFASMIERLRTALEQAGIRDQIVVIERTGRYHRPVQRAFAKAGFEVRIIHPLTTKQHRQPANPGNKTDDGNERLRNGPGITSRSSRNQDQVVARSPDLATWPTEVSNPKPGGRPTVRQTAGSRAPRRTANLKSGSYFRPVP
jgi:ribosomal protein S11